MTKKWPVIARRSLVAGFLFLLLLGDASAQISSWPRGVKKVGDTMFGLLQWTGTTHAGLRLNNLTTAERDAIASPTEGMLIYNTTTDAINVYANGAWSAVGGGSVTSVSGGTTGFSFTAGATPTMSGILIPANGGTGIASYTTGDILYASNSLTFAKLAGVATGNVLLSGGVATAPAWGKVTLGTHTTGTLTEAQGGTGDTDLDDVLGTASEIEVTDGANSVIAGNVTVGLADEPIIPGDYFTWPISTAPSDPAPPVAGMSKYQPGDSGFVGWYGAGLTKDRFALVERDGIEVTAVDSAVAYFNGLDAVDGSADVVYSPTLRSLIISRGATSGGGIILKEDSDNGDQSVTIKAPSSITSSYDFITPTSMGTSGQFLKTTGSAGTWDNINSADIDLTDNYTWTGNHDFGGATGLEVPNGAGGTTVNATGEVTVDATTGSYNFYDGTAERVVSPVHSKSFTVIVATTSSDYHIWRVPTAYAQGITIISISVLNEGAGDVVGCLDEMDSDGNNAVAIDSDMTAVAGTNNTNTTLDNPTVDAGDYIDWHTTTVAAANVQLTVTFEFRINP